MPPNRGGLCMDRCQYPYESNDDYIDLAHIEALTTAIQACDIATLTQSPMHVFPKQIANTIKSLQEILSHRQTGAM